MSITVQRLLEGSILDRQIENEMESVRRGALRYRRLAEQAIERGVGSSLKAAERMLVHWFRVVVAGVEDECRRWDNGEYGEGRAAATPIIKQLSSEEVAYIALSQLTSDCMASHEGMSLVSACQRIGGAVLAELNLRELKKDRKAWEAINLKAKKLTPKKVNYWARKSLETPLVHKSVSIAVGGMLIRLMIEQCSAGSYENEVFRPSFKVFLSILGGKKKPQRRVKMLDEVRDRIDEGHALREVMRPRYMPMLVEPYPWSKEQPGGYVRIRTPFISQPTAEQKRALSGADLSQSYRALEAVSACGWAVNHRILETMQAMWKQGGGVLGVPHADDKKFPPRVDFATCTLEEKKDWKGEASEVHTHNARLRGIRAEFLSRLSVANQFASEEAFYFPHQFDFRGRMYPVPVWLHHHGDDVARGLLQFAKEVPIDNDGRVRICIHAANCWGLDKVPYAAREAWAHEHSNLIRECARDPFGCEWWHQAEKPWQFLAACIGLVDNDAGDRLPIQIDGTCNGLQHYAAMTRDAAGGDLVNLTASDLPQDVYSEVARAVADRVSVDAVQSNPHAILVDGRIDRALVKRVVMTAVYGVTEHGAARHVTEELAEMFPDMERSARFKAGLYVGRLGLNSLGEVCRGASQAMDWIRDHASRIVHADREVAVRWDTPMGFPVLQPYRRWRSCYVQTLSGRMEIKDKDDNSVPTMRTRQVNGSAPNFVHSLDACHMMRTALRCREEGIAFAMVHDSFWTHAGTADRLDRITRETFVELHEKPALELLAKQWEKRYGIPMTPPPMVGTLNLRDVLDSPYFFS